MIPRFLLAALLLWAGLGCSKPKSTPAESARLFLQAVVEGHAEKAYETATFAFKALQSDTAFQAATAESNLVGGQVEISETTMEDKRARVRATVRTTHHEEKKFNVLLVQEAGAWRVVSMRPPKSEGIDPADDRFAVLGKTLAFNEAARQPVPDEKSVLRLARESMGDFAQAVSKRDFSDFYKHVSSAWQSQLTERQLERAFQGFMTQDVNLVGVAELGAVMDAPPMVSTEGLLLVSGHYVTKPYEVVFLFKYIYELGEWKLFGLDVNLREAEPTKPAEGAAAAPTSEGKASGETGAPQPAAP